MGFFDAIKSMRDFLINWTDGFIVENPKLLNHAWKSKFCL